MNLLSNCTSGGCGSKIGPAELEGFLKELPIVKQPGLLIGFDASDDAAVYQLSADHAVVSTVDFFPPMVDDAYLFGKIAAANALSDVYAMGGKPVMALNLVCFPQKMDKAILGEILRGGAEKVGEAQATLAGGHSIYDHEPKYGLAVTGVVHPKKFWRNNTPKAGDCLILTKALGTGLVLSAVRAHMAKEEHYQKAVASMERLNKYAAEKCKEFSIHACTDVTGFSLAGHGLEMAGEAYTLMIDTAALPILPGAYTYAQEYLATAAGQRNRKHVGDRIDYSTLEEPLQEILFDPQTSGGLLISLPMEEGEELCKQIRKEDPQATIIGQVVAREDRPLIFL
ncbi:MAG: selenide, water dikinase SelD [Clostridiales bacterium]|nr:selenide, water dikinase SelD [Clostridiales bacterium]